MKRILPSRENLLRGWRGWVCVLLIGLVLYNPFAGLFGSTAGLSYDHLARNRATVGASELQHFSPVTNSTGQTTLDVDVLARDLMLVLREKYQSTDLQEVFPPQTEFTAQLWNRPPPSL